MLAHLGATRMTISRPLRITVLETSTRTTTPRLRDFLPSLRVPSASALKGLTEVSRGRLYSRKKSKRLMSELVTNIPIIYV